MKIFILKFHHPFEKCEGINIFISMTCDIKTPKNIFLINQWIIMMITKQLN